MHRRKKYRHIGAKSAQSSNKCQEPLTKKDNLWHLKDNYSEMFSLSAAQNINWLKFVTQTPPYEIASDF